MGEYEWALRTVFPHLYRAAQEFCDGEEEAAVVAQLAFVRAWGEIARV